MRGTMVTDEFRESYAGPLSLAIPRMLALNAQGKPYLCYDHKGRLRKPRRVLEDWYRMRMLEAMAQHEAQGA